MKQLARRHCFWNSFDKDIEKLVKECQPCALVKSAPAKAPTHHWEAPENNFDRVHIDYAGPFLDHHFLILVDAKSKWLEVRILKTSPTSKSTIEHLMDIFTTHGFPRVLVSDNASIFTTPEFTDFCNLHRIFPKYIAPRHPATNGQAEHLVQTSKRELKNVLRLHCCA